MLGLFVGVLGIGMLLYLVPGQGTMGASAFDVVAEVDGVPITIADVTMQMSRIERSSGAIPQPLRWLYAQQILGELVFEKELGVEAQRLGIRVTDQERADRIRLLIPTAFIGDSFIGMDQYAAQVLARYGVGVAEFEATVTQTLLQENFRRLMTDGITVSPAEIEQEFRRRNEKVKISYVVVNPDDLQSEIEASDADLQAYFEANQPRYMVPERRGPFSVACCAPVPKLVSQRSDVLQYPAVRFRTSGKKSGYSLHVLVGLEHYLTSSSWSGSSHSIVCGAWS